MTPKPNPKPYAIARHLNGISLNPDIEFLLDDRDEIHFFASPQEAKDHLTAQGLTEKHMEFLYLIDFQRNQYRFMDGSTWQPSVWTLPEIPVEDQP